MSPAEAPWQRERQDAAPIASLAVRLPRDRTAPATARHRVHARLADLVPPDTADDVLLVVSELVTNAVMHGDGEIELRVDFDGTRVRGEVTDEGGGFILAALRRPANRAGGNGLYLVGAVTARWGVREQTGHVWFELPVALSQAG